MTGILPAGALAAEGISGYLDFGYSSFDTKSQDNLGNESRTESESFAQRYSLLFGRSLAPNLHFYANGLFEKVDSTTTTNGISTDSTLTRVQPVLDLTLRSPVYTAGVHYSKREETQQGTDAPETTDVLESYRGILGLKPVSRYLPSFDMRFERSHSYDKARETTDTKSDLVGLTMNYTPTNTLLLQYRPSYTDTTNRVTDIETTNLSQIGRAEYSNSFFQNRVAFNTSYNVSVSALKTSTSGTGTVDVSVLPFAGLASIDDTPLDGALAQNSALIDGNSTASAGINIGLPPIGGDTRERNMGIDFSIDETVNTLLVWVDRTLPAAIAGSFSWAVYTSSDNQTWTLYTTVSPAPFGIFENRFEISFAPVHSRYIKVVVKPLAPSVPGAASYPDIFVTELQAFSRLSAAEANRTARIKNEVYSFDGRILLLRGANLYFQTSYFLARTESATDQQRWTLTNALTANHRFNKVFSGSAYAGRRDFSEPTDEGFAYVGSLSLEAIPLSTLRHNLAYSGEIDQKKDGRTTTNSLYLYNYAQLYAGVDLTASAGRVVQDKPGDVTTESTNLSAGANLQPHRTLNLGFFLTQSRSHTTIAGTVDQTGWSRRTDQNASYHPTETLYLVAGFSTVADQDRTRRAQSYAANWSPFLGGDLQFSVDYNESLSSEKNAKNKNLTPAITWKFARKAYLSTAYQMTWGESDEGRSESKTLSVGVRAYF